MIDIGAGIFSGLSPWKSRAGAKSSRAQACAWNEFRLRHRLKISSRLPLAIQSGTPHWRDTAGPQTGQSVGRNAMKIQTTLFKPQTGSIDGVLAASNGAPQLIVCFGAPAVGLTPDVF